MALNLDYESYFPGGVICFAFGFEFLVVDCSADRLFCLTFNLIEFAFNFIFIR